MTTLSQSLELVQLPKANYAEIVKAFARLYVMNARNQFTSEDVSAAYELSGNPIPDEPRVWGVAFRQLSKDGIIVPAGWTTYKGKKGHCKPSRVWRSAKQPEQFEAREIIGKQAKLF